MVLASILSLHALEGLGGDGWTLFLTRGVRMWAYGATGVILALYLSAVGLSDQQIGTLMTGTLVGDAAISLMVTLTADRYGRRRMLLLGCSLKLMSAAVFAYVAGPQYWVLLAAATLGVISPSGNEVGPFMALEQSMLSDHVHASKRTGLFAWYNLWGYTTTAFGAFSTGLLTTFAMQHWGVTALDSYRLVFVEYGSLALILFLLTLTLTGHVEAAAWQAAHAVKQQPQAAKRAGLNDTEAAQPLLGPDADQSTHAEAATPACQEFVHTAGAPSQPVCTNGRPHTSHASDNNLEQHNEPALANSLASGQHAISDSVGCVPQHNPSVAAADGVNSQHVLAAVTDAVQDHSTPAQQQGADATVVMTVGSREEEPQHSAGGCTSASSSTGQASQLPAGHQRALTAPHAVTASSHKLGLSPQSRRIVVHLSMLFTLDSFAGGLITGSLLAYFFHVRWGAAPAYLGALLCGANIVAGISSLVAGWVAAHIGLVNTMVFTHLPSNVLTLLVPLMPTLGTATAMVIARFCISQMDVAPRQSYVSGVVPAAERTAAMGITNIVKSLGAALGPAVTGYLAAHGLWNWAFYLAGGLKIVYDLLLLWSFRSLRAEHETVAATAAATAVVQPTAAAKQQSMGAGPKAATSAV